MSAKNKYEASAEALYHSKLWRTKNAVSRELTRWQIKTAGFSVGKLPGGVFVGATGGSGTRVIARALQHAGLYMGSRHNFALDAVDFVPLIARWLPDYLAGSSPAKMKQELEVCCFRFVAGKADSVAGWGAKAPRFIYLLPFFEKQLPQLKFVHVVRDGRDMAFADNQSQLRDYGKLVLGAEFSNEPKPVQSIALWGRINCQAMQFGREQMPERYFLLRFEDLCARPEVEIPRLFEFVGSDSDPAPAIAEVQRPPTIGRWRQAPQELMEQVESAAAEALRTFQYT